MLQPLEKEAKVRELLGKEFGVGFIKKRLSLRTGILHEFDLVSHDGKIVGEVTSAKHTEKAYPNTRFPRAMLACRYLEMVDAERKLMIFTDKQFYENFKEDSQGLLFGNIEIRVSRVGEAEA